MINLSLRSPTVAILQWRNEIEAHTTGFTVRSPLTFEIHTSHNEGGSYQTLVWHGGSRETKVPDIAENDIVLTTVSGSRSTRST